MKHFSLAEWADFARKVATKEQEQAMQAHLDTGCKSCGKVFRMWTGVRGASQREAGYEPPDAAVRQAKALLAMQAWRKGHAKAQLLFDSLRNPAMAGVRAAGTSARQMLYGIGPYRIDLRMEPQMDSDKVELVGQILNSADPVKSGAQATVKLLRGRKILAESQTNALGEFHLECCLEGQLQLLLSLPRSRDVKIPLLVPSDTSLTGHLEVTDSDGVIDAQKIRKRSTGKRV